ncbi:MAG: hypothetical protein GXO36_05600, partial [Chloroflexi bacterium]|nr:hypothetical protein [Chloroflexota bacterium]
MNTQVDTRAFDRFKLVVTVILSLIILWILLQLAGRAAAPAPTPTQAMPEAQLPALPKAGFEWKWDAAQGVLLDPNGLPRYRLVDGQWVPVVPEELKAKLPKGFKVLMVDGQWHITGPEGKALYRWNPDTFAWEGLEVAAELPPFPKAGFEWKWDAAQGVLLDPDGLPRYRLV